MRDEVSKRAEKFESVNRVGELEIRKSEHTQKKEDNSYRYEAE